MKKLCLIAISMALFSLQAFALDHRGHFSEPASKKVSSSCSKTIDMGGVPNMLFKNSNVHGGRGRSLLDQGHSFGGTRTLRVLGANNKQIGCFGLWACDHPFGCRYYQAMCHDSLSNSAFLSAARKNGGTTVYVTNGSGRCYSFPASSARYGHVFK